MKEIKLYDFNGGFFKIEGEQQILKRLQTFFEFDHPNKFLVKSMSKKYGAWNGKVKLFKLNDMMFPIGFVQHLRKVCKNLGIKIGISKKAHHLLFSNKKFDKDEIKREILTYFDDDFMKKIKVNIYDHQIDSIIKAIIEKRGLFDIHTRGGKSVIIYGILRYMFENLPLLAHEKLLLIVPRIHLCEQMYEDFDEYTNSESFMKEFSVIYSNSDKKDLNKQFQITTYQSLINNPHIFRDVKFVMVDECHNACDNVDTEAGKQLQQILNGLVNTEYRFGCSGTIPEVELDFWSVKSKFGEVLYKKDLLESIEEGIVTDFTINSVIIDYMDADTMYENAYSDYMNYASNISSYEERAYITKALMRDGILKKNDKIFQTFQRKEALNTFKKYHEKAFPELGSYRFDGSVSMKRRSKVKTLIKETPPDKGAICFGTLSVMNAGITIPNLNVVMFCDGSKKPETIRQAIGRSLGLDYENDEKEAVIIELIDYIKYKRKTGYSIKHMIERTKMYTDKKYKQVFHYYLFDPKTKEFTKKEIPSALQKIIDKYTD